MAISMTEFTDARISHLLPFPAEDANKYTRGFLTVIGGSAPYPGAICMASKAAYMVGAGYVEAVASDEALPILRAYNVEAVARSFGEWDISTSRLAAKKAGHPCACLIGSGLDPNDKVAREIFVSVLDVCRHPTVIDGGAIGWLASEEGRSLASACAARKAPLVVTPHMGEAARLAAPLVIKPPDESDAGAQELASYAEELSQAYCATVVLKGPDTYISSPDSSPVVVMKQGTAALAKAGTGDVLAGMIAGILAQGLEPLNAATLGATLHARAGIEASIKMSEISVGAPDVIAYIPSAIRHFADAV